MSFQIPQELQEKLTTFEQIKAQLQMVLSQKGEMDARKKEVEEAVKALESQKDREVYRRVGDLLFKVKDTETLQKELKEEDETIGVRIGSIEKQEKGLKEMYEKLGAEINEALKGYQ